MRTAPRGPPGTALFSRLASLPPQVGWGLALGYYGSRGSGDAEPLTDLDLVGVLEDVAVGLEDLRVEAAVPVVALGDLPERLALRHLVPLLGAPRVAAARHRLSPVAHATLSSLSRCFVLLRSSRPVSPPPAAPGRPSAHHWSQTPIPAPGGAIR